MATKRKTGRRNLDKSSWEFYALNAGTEVMRRIAVCAQAQGWTMTLFARLAGRDRGNVVRSMLASKPYAPTIAAYVAALKLPAIAHRALIAELTDRDINVVMMRMADTGVLQERDMQAPGLDIVRACRAYVLSEYRLDVQRDPSQAFLSILNPEADVFVRLREHLGDYPPHILERAKMIRRRLPAAADFTSVDVYQLCELLAIDIPAAPHTAPTADLSEIKNALGRVADSPDEVTDEALLSKARSRRTRA